MPTLKNDIVGAYSGIVYAMKGDNVEILKEQSGMCLVRNSDRLFYVFPNELTDSLIEESDTIEKPKQSEPKQSVPTKKTKNTPVKKVDQQFLF